jgi:outer membrane protein assembly factor BamD (BamD/ComL family)
MKISHARIENALFNMGIIYRDEMKDASEAARAFKEQVTRYPDGQNALLAYYSLYNLLNTEGDAAGANVYKSLLIQKFPESSTARLLSDPAYALNLEKEQAGIENAYQLAYDNYTAGAYAEAVRIAGQSLSNWPNDASVPRFRLLRALSIGKLNGNEAMKTELESLTTEFPGHEVSEYAARIIALIYNVQPDLKLADEQVKAEEIYRVPGNEPHFFGIACFPGADINQLNFNLINFNLDNFNRQNLAIVTEYAGDLALLLVQPFADTIAAFNYLKAFTSASETVLAGYSVDKAKAFLISAPNLEILKNDKNFDRYALFYNKFYLKK